MPKTEEFFSLESFRRDRIEIYKGIRRISFKLNLEIISYMFIVAVFIKHL